MTETIDYLPCIEDGDMIRITHEVSVLEQPPNQKPVDAPRRWTREIRKQIRLRKQIMSGLHTEIRELENLIE